MARKIYKCPYCDEKYMGNNLKEQEQAKLSLYEHMEVDHIEQLNGLSPSQAHFNWRNKKDGGKCVICRKPTSWNEVSERYERFCSERCKNKYRDDFKKRMKRKYGKEHILDDMNQQKKMLANRSISGKYKWSDGGEVPYVGSYEKDFLEFLDVFMQFPSTDIIGPAPQIIPYKYKGEDHIYLPDFYITSLNLIVEIKDGQDNPNTHPNMQIDKEKEKEKDKVMAQLAKKGIFRYLKVLNKDYSLFINFLLELKTENR